MFGRKPKPRMVDRTDFIVPFMAFEVEYLAKGAYEISGHDFKVRGVLRPWEDLPRETRARYRQAAYEKIAADILKER